MALTISYNKIALQQFEKGLKIREGALTTIRSKESALRAEIKRQRKIWEDLGIEKYNIMEAAAGIGVLWNELDRDVLRVRKVETTPKSFAGVRYQELKSVEFQEKSYHLLSHPLWWIQGIVHLKKLRYMLEKIALKEQQIQILEKERKKTTQKLNLYEKVQIPAYIEAIRKIKRFLEDQETLEKATQKIVKKRKTVA